MDTSLFSVSMIIIFLFFWVKLCSSIHVCKPAYCTVVGPEIRFPFRLIGVQTENCGYPGFDLSCNNKSQTIITLPESGDFLVNRIYYAEQKIYLNDPDFCLPKRILNFSLHSSPFAGAPGKDSTFYNCSGLYTGNLTNRATPLPCLDRSRNNYMYFAPAFTIEPGELPPNCKMIRNVSVSLELSQLTPAQYWSSEDIELIWNDPNCLECEVERLFCGLINDSGLNVGCSSAPRNGLSRGTKIGIGIPVLFCVIGTAYSIFSKWRSSGNRRNNTNSGIFPAGALQAIPSTAVAGGLDLKTIESYPKLVLGESRRFPDKISENSCSICLSDYQAKEILRSIPECNHYFHANCVDEWLKLNATCPVCRNMPESTLVTAVSSSPASMPSSPHV